MPRARLLTICLITCLVLVLAYLATDFSSQNKKRSALLEQIGASNTTLRLLPTPNSGSEGGLATAQATYQTASGAVSIKSVPTDVIKALLNLTDHYNFKVNPITTEEWSRNSIGNSIYRMLPLNLGLEGKLPDIQAFLKDLQNENRYPSLEIVNTQIEPIISPEANSLYDTILQLRIVIIERISTGQSEAP